MRTPACLICAARQARCVTRLCAFRQFTFCRRFRILDGDDFIGRRFMVHVLVRHKVSDYNRWKEAFDSHLNTRKHAGETGFRLFHNVEDPREVVCCWIGGQSKQARKFMNSDDLRTAMAARPAWWAPPRCSTWRMCAGSSHVSRLAFGVRQKFFSPVLLTPRAVCAPNPNRAGRGATRFDTAASRRSSGTARKPPVLARVSREPGFLSRGLTKKIFSDAARLLLANVDKPAREN